MATKTLMLTAVKSGIDSGFCSKSCGVITFPKFSECLIDSMNPSSSSVLEIPVEMEEDSTNFRLTLSNVKEKKKNTNCICLAHPEFCPIRQISLRKDGGNHLFPTDPRFTNIPATVCVILESSDGHILLTRRAKTLVAFPGVWVPPGGYVDFGESLAQAGLRELNEETGISVQMGQAKRIANMALWESVYPPTLARGSPKRHAVVVYIHVLMDQTNTELSCQMKASEAEVDMLGWFCKNSISQITSSPKGSQGSDEILKVFQVIPGSGGLVEPCEYPLRNLCQTLPELTVDDSGDIGEYCSVERISTGTIFALKKWLDLQSNQSCDLDKQ